jgi:hypothetical protein
MPMWVRFSLKTIVFSDCVDESIGAIDQARSISVGHRGPTAAVSQ